MTTETHLVSLGLPAHTGYRETVLCSSTKWSRYEWDSRAACCIEEHGSVVLHDYTGGVVYTTVHGSISQAVEVLKLILTPPTDPDRSRAYSISQQCRILSKDTPHGSLVLQEVISPLTRQHLEYHQFSVNVTPEQTTLTW